MKLIPRYFIVFCILLAGCVPIQPPAAAPAAAAPSGGAAAPGPVAELAGEFELVQLVVDFPQELGLPPTRMAACCW